MTSDPFIDALHAQLPSHARQKEARNTAGLDTV